MRLRDAGELGDEEFDARLEELSVQDADGRWWAKHRETGAWHFYDGSDWIPATPPGYEEAVQEPDAEASRDRTQPSRRSEVDEPGEKRRGALPWLLAAGIFGVIVLVAAAAYLGAGDAGETGGASGNGGTATVGLPNVVGTPGDEAERILEGRGFQVESDSREASEEEAGEVIAQSPSGDEAKKGSKVTITIGRAPEEENEPDSGEERGSEEPALEEAPAPGYGVVQDPSGSLSVEVPEGWTVLTGADSEYPGFEVTNWSNWAGEDITSSITAAPNITAFHYLDPPVSGMYIVASKTLAQMYTDDELIYSTLYAGQAENCEEGPSEPFRRPSLSGKVQTWEDCRGQGITNFIVAAHPEGRECVVVLQARLAEEADRQAIKQVLDTFKVDCAKVPDA